MAENIDPPTGHVWAHNGGARVVCSHYKRDFVSQGEEDNTDSTAQRQTAVTAHFSSEQLLLFAFAQQMVGVPSACKPLKR